MSLTKQAHAARLNNKFLLRVTQAVDLRTAGLSTRNRATSEGGVLTALFEGFDTLLENSRSEA